MLWLRIEGILGTVCASRVGSLCLVGIGSLAILGGKADGFTDPYMSHARNVKTFPATVGVPNAVGNGVTDDTAAFQACLQYGRSGSQYQTVGTAVYVPPGTYLISQPLVVWAPMDFCSDWRNPATIVLENNAPAFQTDAPADEGTYVPMIAFNSGYEHTYPDTNWWSESSSANNIFFVRVHDLNFKIGSGNPAACGMNFSFAQACSLRNVTIDATQGDYIGAKDYGDQGGVVLSQLNINSSGSGNYGLVLYSTFHCVVRDTNINSGTGAGQSSLVFSGPYNFNFLRLSTEGVSAYVNDASTGLVDFEGASFGSPDLGNLSTASPSAIADHFESCKFANPTAIYDTALRTATNPSTGTLTQFSRKQIYVNGALVNGNDPSIATYNVPAAIPTPAIPRPTANTVDVTTLGAIGDGVTDNTAVIQSALANYNELFFPAGTYLVSKQLVVRAGTKLLGHTRAVIELASGSSGYNAGSVQPFMVFQGATGQSTLIYGLVLENLCDGGVCLAWYGDPSSVVIDCCPFNISANNLAPVAIIYSGGYFEQFFTYSDNLNSGPGPAAGVVVSGASGPLWLVKLDVEHFYYGTALTIQNSSNVFILNYQGENSKLEVSIQNGDNVWIHGAASAADTYGEGHMMEIKNSTVRLFGVSYSGPTNYYILDQDTGNKYGPAVPAGSPGPALGGYVKTISGSSIAGKK